MTEPPSASRPRRARPSLRRLGLGLVGVFAGLQLVPCGHAHDNPPVQREPAWDSPRTRELAVRACFDCHSHETRWPWYSYVAPVSWIVEEHTEDGRRHLDFSAWDRKNEDLHEILEVMEEGEMPLPGYLRFHSEAVLDAEEQAALIEGFRATLAADPGGADNEKG